jgi:uncharacterized protein YwgA
MNQLQRASLIIDIINKLREKGSWCGVTHIQKSIYFLQELTKVPMEFDFILYKHGPFSFDLRDELTAMRAYRLIEIELRPPYGPGLYPTKSGTNVHNHFPKTINKYSRELTFVTEYLGNKGVAELERMGTALLVTLENQDSDIRTKALKIHRLKPHVSEEDAYLALQEVEKMKNSFNSFSLQSPQ